MKLQSRKEFLKKITTISAGCCVSFPFVNLFAMENKKPNIVLLIADDCSYWDLGCYGSKDSLTPNIDKLARQGIRFTQCFQSAPMCSPTRHNLYTGLYPVKTGAYPNHTFAREGTKSIVHYLKPLGYRVALSGKRHISPEPVFPFEYLPENNNPDFKAVDNFIADSIKKDQPFCLFLCSNEPHGPWDKGDASLFDPKKIWMPPFMVDTPETRINYCNYLAEINYLDGQVAEALALLEKYGIADNTLFVFLSEQGNSFPFSKWTCYEVGVQSACIVRWPGKTQANILCTALIEYSDILPTFIEAAGGPVPDILDGESLMPLLSGKKTTHKNYVFSLQTTRGINFGSDYYGIRSVRSERFRYIWNLTPEATFQNGVTHQKKGWWVTWKEKAKSDPHAAEIVKKYQKRPEEELYDIQKDRYCEKNLADIPEYQKEKESLRVELLKWMENCGDKGQETEMEALYHQSETRRKNWLKRNL